MSDLFHGKVSFGYVERVFNVIRHAHHHMFQILTFGVYFSSGGVDTRRTRMPSSRPYSNAFVRSPAFARTPGNGSKAKRRVMNFRIDVVSYGV